MKKTTFQFGLLLVLFLWFLAPFQVNAYNRIEKIQVEILLQKNGDANVKEVWDTFLDRGTELYKSYGNLETYSISDFNVSMGNGEVYQYQDSWNVKDDFDQKKYKNGIVKGQNKIELCWGISEYGTQQYKIQYKIRNLVKQYQDKQGIYFTFMPTDMDPSPQKVIIEIESDALSFEKENSSIAASSYPNGVIFYQNGKIVMETRNALEKDQYMTARIAFQNGLFHPASKVDKSFAEVGETKSFSSTPKNVGIPFQWIIYMVPVVLFFLFMLISFFRYLIMRRSQHIGKHARKEKIEVEDDFYYREIPLGKNLCKLSYLAYKFDLLEEESHILGAYLLKWLKEKRISFQEKEDTKKLAIQFKNIGTFQDKMEERLKNIFLSASCDGFLEMDDFKEWCRSHYQQLVSWFSDFSYFGKTSLEQDGLLKRERFEETIGYRKVTREYLVLLEGAKKVGKQLVGLKHFLLDFGNFQEKEANQAIVWEEYLILAELFGMTKEVEKNMERFYPDYLWLDGFKDRERIDFALQYAKVGYQTCRDTFAMAQGNLRTSFYGSDDTSTGKNYRVDSSPGDASSGGFSSGGGVR